MKSLRDGWYVSESDDYALGPMSRDELFARHTRGEFGGKALAWHTEIAEWRPLARLATGGYGGGTTPSGAAEHSAQARFPATEQSPPRSKAEVKASRKAQLRARAQTGPPPNDDEKRLLSHANPSKTMVRPNAAASAPRAKPAATAPAANAQTGTALLEAFRRFLARIIDTLTVGAFAAVALWSVAAESPIGDDTLAEMLAVPPSTAILFYLALLALVPIEALSLAFTGTTPGKALLGLQVARRPGGGRPDPFTALRRSIHVLWRGLALGIPVISLFTVIVAGTRHLNKGRTSWDDMLGLETRAAPLPAARWQLALIVTVIVWLVFVSGQWQELVFGRLLER